MTNEITSTGDSWLGIPAEEVAKMFGDSTLDTTTGLSFNVVKIMRESAQFEMASDDYVKTIEGHILFKHRGSQWWEIPFDERTEDDDPMPQCYSIDGFSPCGGAKLQSDLCSTCPKNQFGSGADGRGKACRNTMRFLIIQDGAVLPVVVVAPPTSLSKKGSLQHWLNSVPNDVAMAYTAIGINTSNGTPVVDYWPAHVELSLEKKDFANGMSASILNIKTLDVVTPTSDPEKIRLLYGMRKEVTELYKQEQTAYIETESEEIPI